MIPGSYGGEPIIGRGMEGMLGAFEAWLAEIAVLVRWARQTGSRTVVLSGVSLGSLTAQLAATASRRLAGRDAPGYPISRLPRPDL